MTKMFMKFIDRSSIAMPPSIAASLEPMVEQPTGFPSAGAFQRMGPAVIEDVFALAVGFRIKRRDADKRSARPRRKVMRLPAAARAHRPRPLQRQKKAMRGERVDGPPATLAVMTAPPSSRFQAKGSSKAAMPRCWTGWPMVSSRTRRPNGWRDSFIRR